MIGRKAVIGLALLCSLAFCAVVAQGAAAEQTVFTCAPGAGAAPTKDFTDAHCDNTVEPGKGTFHHVTIEKGKKTEITLTNSATENETKSAARAHLFISKLHGVSEVEVNCTTISGTGTMENTETSGVMGASGEGTIKFTGCTANKNCTVAEPIETAVKGALVEGLSSEGMGLKFEPKTGTTFTSITFSGASCPLKAFGAIPVAGSTIGTAHGEPKGEGATVYFGEMGSITVGGETASLEGKVTLKGPNGNALTATTPPY
jgi:hypothetical protein